MTYGELCGTAKQLADQLVSCLCNLCSGSCSNCTAYLDVNGAFEPPDPTCYDCVSNASQSSCSGQSDNCFSN
jgi:hypothetical protein